MKKALGFLFAAALLGLPGVIVARNYAAPFLSCAAQYPIISLGNAGRFYAVTNVDGPFMWTTGEYGVYDAGPEFATPFTRLGVERVTVVWGGLRASCHVEVVLAPGFGEPYAPPVVGAGQYGPGPNVTLSSTAYPSMPNAGFEPQTFATFAFAGVLLLSGAIALYPHVRKAFAVVTR